MAIYSALIYSQKYQQTLNCKSGCVHNLVIHCASEVYGAANFIPIYYKYAQKCHQFELSTEEFETEFHSCTIEDKALCHGM